MSSHTELRTDGGVVRRTIQGRAASIHRDPDEIRVEWRVGRPIYFGVRVGDRIKDADRDVESPLIDQWTVTEITPTRVVGVHAETGDEREWDRERLERGLAIGNYATTLSAFERVAVHRVGVATDRAAGRPPEPHVTVIAYGNNGERYGRRYRFLDADERRVALRDEDPAVGRLSDERRRQLAELVEAALVEDGYDVVEAADPGVDADDRTGRARDDGRDADGAA
jgi:hypothetical protein